MSAPFPGHPDALAWIPRASAPDLPSTAVHVWYIDLAAVGGTGEAVLSAEEHDRATAMALPEARARFTSARTALRRILGDYLGCAPRAVPIHTRPDGKPTLADSETHGIALPDSRGPASPRTHRLAFNISHAREHALIAVTRAREVGVDIECGRALASLDRLIRRVLTEAEARFLETAPEDEKVQRFLGLWTRKEALAKARGVGIFRGSLREVDVAPDAGAAPWRTVHLPADGGTWSLMSLRPPATDCIAALAVEGGPVEPSAFVWRPDGCHTDGRMRNG